MEKEIGITKKLQISMSMYTDAVESNLRYDVLIRDVIF